MNAHKFNGLNDQQRAWLEVGCNDSMIWMYVRSEALRFKAMRELSVWPEKS